MMEMTGFKWTPRSRRAAFMLAIEPKKYTEIAQELNITVQTLWNWRQDGDFNRKVGQISNKAYRAWIDEKIAIDLYARKLQ